VASPCRVVDRRGKKARFLDYSGMSPEWRVEIISINLLLESLTASYLERASFE